MLKTLDARISFRDSNGGEHWSIRDAAAPGIALDPVGLLSLVSFQYLPFDRTPFQGVLKLYRRTEEDRPHLIGEVLGEFRAPQRRGLSKRQAADRLSRGVVEDLQARVQGAKRLVILLSGGLDSRLILAALLRLRKLGKATDEIRAISWGKEGCADVSLAQEICEREGIDWDGVSLDVETLRTNISECATTIGPLVSPVHLHAMPKLRTMVDHEELVLVGTLGNAVIRGEYLWRNVSYGTLPKPADWLELLEPGFREAAIQEYDQALEVYRASIPAGAAVHRYEVEMFTSYYQGLLLYAYQYLDKIGVSYSQAFSSLALFDEARTIYPLLRNERLACACIQRLWPSLSDIPTANLAGSYGSHPCLERLDPAMHDYQAWVAQLSEELLDYADDAVERSGGALSREGPRRALARVQSGRAGAREASYLLAYLAGLGAFLSAGDGRQKFPRVGGSAVALPSAIGRAKSTPLPPWGFASQPLDGLGERIAGRLRQARNLIGQLLI